MYKMSLISRPSAHYFKADAKLNTTVSSSTAEKKERNEQKKTNFIISFQLVIIVGTIKSLITPQTCGERSRAHS